MGDQGDAFQRMTTAPKESDVIHLQISRTGFRCVDPTTKQQQEEEADLTFTSGGISSQGFLDSIWIGKKYCLSAAFCSGTTQLWIQNGREGRASSSKSAWTRMLSSDLRTREEDFHWIPGVSLGRDRHSCSVKQMAS